MEVKEPFSIEKKVWETIAESNNGEHKIDNSGEKIKEALLKAVDNICGWTKEETRRQHETW